MKQKLLTQYARDSKAITKLIKDAKGRINSQRPAMAREAAILARKLARDLDALAPHR